MISIHMGVISSDERVQRLLELIDYEYIGMYGETDPDPHGGINGHEAIVLEKNGYAVGICGLSYVRARDVYVLHRLFVRHQYRRQGYSRMLMTAAELFVRGKGGTRIELETGETQTAALALYEHLGYRPTLPFGFYADQATSRFLGKDL